MAQRRCMRWAAVVSGRLNLPTITTYYYTLNLLYVYFPRVFVSKYFKEGNKTKKKEGTNVEGRKGWEGSVGR